MPRNRREPEPERAVSGNPGVPRAVVFDPDSGLGLALAQELRERQPWLVLAVVTTRETPIDGPVDVGIITLADARLDGLAFAGDLGSRHPGVQTVFSFDQRDAAALAAARSVGLQRVIPRNALSAWLQAGLRGLVDLARAQRAQARAERSLPPIPLWAGDPITTPLPVAERTFRETYLRSLLSDSASHVVAARKAGLPYTTLCSMLKKLDIL